MIDYVATQDANCFSNVFQWAEKIGVASFLSLFFECRHLFESKQSKRAGRVANPLY
jgi:hypothetical protein